MNIDWLIPCRYLEIHDGLGTLIGAGIDTFTVPALPAQIQVVIAMRLTGTADELDPSIDHPIRSVVRGPDDTVISDVEGVGQFGAPGARPDWLTGIIIPSAVLFVAEQEGAYTFEFSVDQAQAAIPLHVTVGQPPGA